MIHLLFKIHGVEYQTPDTVLWKAEGELVQLDTLYRGEPENLNVVLDRGE